MLGSESLASREKAVRQQRGRGQTGIDVVVSTHVRRSTYGTNLLNIFFVANTKADRAPLLSSLKHTLASLAGISLRYGYCR